MINKIYIFYFLTLMGHLWANPQSITNAPLPIIAWDDEVMVIDDDALPAQHNEGQEAELPALPDSIPTSCLPKLIYLCNQHLHTSQCCRRMYQEPRGQRDWYYPCCFCAYDHTDCHNISPLHACNPIVGENGLVFPDCCLRHSCCWHEGICLRMPPAERMGMRATCMCALQCFFLGWAAAQTV